MFSPYEELEQLADLLPDEGDVVLLTRRNGELLCEPFPTDGGNEEGITDPEFYGRLVQANERLNALLTLPLWTSVFGVFWICVGLHLLTGLGWNAWFLDAGVAMFGILGCYRWMTWRQRRYFRDTVSPMLRRQMIYHDVDRYVLLGAIRLRAELRTLMDELSDSLGE